MLLKSTCCGLTPWLFPTVLLSTIISSFLFSNGSKMFAFKCSLDKLGCMAFSGGDEKGELDCPTLEWRLGGAFALGTIVLEEPNFKAESKKYKN